MDIGFGVVKKPLIKAMSQGIEYYPLYENTWRGLRRLCFCIPRFYRSGGRRLYHRILSKDRWDHFFDYDFLTSPAANILLAVFAFNKNAKGENNENQNQRTGVVGDCNNARCRTGQVYSNIFATWRNLCKCRRCYMRGRFVLCVLRCG